MRKNFLLVFLLGLLPLAMWAAPTVPKTAAVRAGTPEGTLTYNKVEQALLASELVLPDDYDTSVGEVFYLALTTDGTPTSGSPKWSTSIPKEKDAGKYRVWYKITSDGTVEYGESIAKIGDVTINPKNAEAGTDFTAPTAVTGLTYDGTAKALLNVEKPAGGHFVYQVRQRNLQNSGWVAGWPSSWQTELPEGTNGTGYQVRYRYVNDDGNYNTWGTSNYVTIPASGNITIAKVDPTFTTLPEANELEYTGSAQTLLKTAAVADYGDVQYRITDAPLLGGGTWGPGDFASIPQRTAAGEYTIQYRVSPGGTTSPGYNWNTTAWQTITVTIANAEPTITTTGELVDDLVYTSAAQPLLKTPVAVNTGNIRYYINKDGAGDGAAITNPAQVTGLAAGEYEVSYDVDVTGLSLLNYKDAGKKSLGTVKIEQAKLTIANVGYTKDFDNTAFEATTENVIKFVDGIGWVGTEGDDDALKAEVLGKLIKHVSGLPQTNVGPYKVLLESQDDPTVNYTVDPLFHAEADLNILKIDNTWKNDVSIAATWPYGSVPATPTAEPNLTKKENGEDAEITYKYYTDAACTTEFTGAIDETMPVGIYYVKAFVEGCNNFFELESVTPASFEITATDPAWTKAVAIEGWEYTKYDATANAPTAEVDDDATITYKYFSDAGCTTEITTDPSTWTIGTYWVKAYAAATANHNAVENGPAEFNVTPTTLPELALTFTAVDYNAKNQQPTIAEVEALITEVDASEYDVTFTDADDNIVSDFTHAGTYYVVITGSGNYAKLDAEGNVNFQKKEFVINTVDPEITAPIANKLTYTAEDQILASEAVSADGTFEYSLTGEDGSWTTDVPAGFDAGDYMVYTKFTPDGDHNEAEVEAVPVTILPAQVKITLTNTLEKDWDGEEFTGSEVAETYVIDGLLGDDVYEIPFTLALPVTEENNFIDAKEYELKKLNLTWKDENVQNYKVAYVTVGSVTINKADIETADFEAPVAKDDLVFNGEEQEIVTAGEVITKYKDAPIGTILFAQGETAPAEDSADWTEDVPAQINAGEYPVWYMIKGDDNHNNVAAAQLTGKIAPKHWIAVLEFEDLEDIYIGKDFMPADLSIKDGEVALVE
ncbi:MAG: hypothetical protein J6Q22_01100, partial [Prevotella sp.]|nr:hypothetical protein [Prevotella sp.]